MIEYRRTAGFHYTGGDGTSKEVSLAVYWPVLKPALKSEQYRVLVRRKSETLHTPPRSRGAPNAAVFPEERKAKESSILLTDSGPVPMG